MLHLEFFHIQHEIFLIDTKLIDTIAIAINVFFKII